MNNVIGYGGSVYGVNSPYQGLLAGYGFNGGQITDPRQIAYLQQQGTLTQPLQAPAPAAPAQTAPVQNQDVKAQMAKLTGQASNALYGGILGYQPQPMTAMGGQQFSPPQGNLVDPFKRMQGLLGQSQQTPRMY